MKKITFLHYKKTKNLSENILTFFHFSYKNFILSEQHLSVIIGAIFSEKVIQ